jgi:hypothetical protein
MQEIRLAFRRFPNRRYCNRGHFSIGSGIGVNTMIFSVVSTKRFCNAYGGSTLPLPRNRCRVGQLHSGTARREGEAAGRFPL